MRPTVILSAMGLAALASASVALAYPDGESEAYVYVHGGQEFRAMNSTSTDYTYIHYQGTGGTGEAIGASNRKTSNVTVIAAPIRDIANIGGTCGQNGHVNVLVRHNSASAVTECWAYVKEVNSDNEPFAEGWVAVVDNGTVDLEFGPIDWTYLNPTDFVVVTCSLPGNNEAEVVDVSTSTGPGCG